MRLRRGALSWSCSSVLGLALGCGTASPPPAEQVVAITSEPIELEHASLTGAVAMLGRALGQPIRLSADAEPLGSCTRVTMFVPAGTPVDVARNTATKSLDELGFTWSEDAGSVVIARREGAAKPAECLEREAMRGVMGSPIVRRPVLDGAQRSPDLKDPFGPVDAVDEGDPLAPVVAGITAVDDTTWRVDMKAVDALSPELLARQARIVPSMKDGQSSGFKLFAIRSSSLPAALGFKNGDRILRVGKQSLNDVDSALAAYEALHEAKTIEVELERRGELRTHTYELVR